jgi:hypothetical protein
MWESQIGDAFSARLVENLGCGVAPLRVIRQDPKSDRKRAISSWSPAATRSARIEPHLPYSLEDSGDGLEVVVLQVLKKEQAKVSAASAITR